MAKEIERKFLVDPKIAEASYLKGNFPWKNMVQGYLAKKPMSTRIRSTVESDKGSKGFITIKGPAVGLVRDEFEYEIPFDDAQYLLSKCDKTLIKTRFYVPFDVDFVAEVDVFLGDLSGKMLVEVELDSPDQRFNIPTWFGKEVSDDSRYSNYNLLYKGWPK